MASPNRSRGLLAVVIGCVLLLVSACSGVVASPNGEGKATLRLASMFLPTSLDPVRGIDAVFSFVETLTRVDAAGNALPFLLAEDPVQVGDGVWKLTLQPGITFQNGKEVDAAAVAASLNRSIEKSLAAKAALPGARFTETGPLEVKVTTPGPSPLLPFALADPAFAIHDAEVADSAGEDPAALAGKGAFTAPYAVAEMTARDMTLEPYADYWQGEPALSGIEVTHVREAAARVAAVQSRQVDVADGANVPDVLTAIEGRQDALLKLSEAPLSAVKLYFNQASAPLSDLPVRQAIALGLDYESLATDFTGGVAEPAHSLLPDGYSLTVPTQTTDLAEASRLLDEAGWVMQDSGVREKDGQPLSVTLLGYTERAEMKPLSVGIQSQLEPLGVKTEIVNQPFDYKMYDDLNGWDMALYSDYSISPTGAPDAYLSTFLATDGEFNLWKVGDPELDQMLEDVVVATNPEERAELLDDIQHWTFDQAYMAVVAFEKDGALVGPNWESYVPGYGYQYAMWDWKTAPTT
jgi:peptide/nickel transport system substrate-binding protein